MERPEQHQIDEAAQRVLRNAMPLDWVLREKHPDYGIDYEVEVAIKGKLTGLCVAVQLKGKKKLKVSQGTVGFPIETHHLKYYVDQRREPVFLVLVDTQRSEGYWMFLQRHALHDLAETSWRTQSTVTIRIPVGQTLRDADGLRRGAEEADKFMTGLRPSALTAAIEAERRRMESLDPRFRVIVKATEMACSYELHALEPVKFSIQFKGSEERVRRMIDDLFGRGLPVAVAPDDVEVSGSNLLLHAFQQNLMVQQVRILDGALRLVATGVDGSEAARIEHLPAKLEGGMREVRVDAGLPRSPFRMKLTLTWTKAGPPPPPMFSFSFPVKEWAGQRLLHLAHFDQIANLFDAIHAGSGLRVELEIDGNRVCGMSTTADQLMRLHDVAEFIAVIRRAREIAVWGGVNPVFPEKLTPELVDEIEELHWTIIAGGTGRPAKGTVITSHALRPKLQKLLEQEKGDFTDGYLRLERGTEPIHFMGEEMPAAGLGYEISHVRLETPIETIRRQLSEAGDDEIVMTWVGTEKSVWTAIRSSRRN